MSNDSTCDTNSRIKNAHDKYDIEYGGFLSNHISHGYIALDKLGASNKRIDKWFEDYIEHDVRGNKIEPAEKPSDSITINDDNWLTFKGKRSNFPDLYEFFYSKINSLGVEKSLEIYYPHLSSGIAGSALHPLIHLGLALDYGKSNVAISEALAYSTHSYLQMIDYSNFKKNDKNEILELTDIIKNVYNDNELWNIMRTTTIEGFQSRLKIFQNSDLILKHCSSWDKFYENPKTKEDQDKLIDIICNELAKLSCFAFHSSGSLDFFLLHGVTGCYATICIIKSLNSFEEKMKLLFQFLYTLVCVYVTEGSLNVFDAKHEDSPISSWDDIIKEITNISSDKQDVHMVKIVYVCKKFSEMYPNDKQLWINTAGCCVSTNIKVTSDYEFGLGLKQNPEIRK